MQHRGDCGSGLQEWGKTVEYEEVKFKGVGEMNPYLKAAVSIWALAAGLLIWFAIAEAGYDFSDSATWTNARADDDTTALVIDSTNQGGYVSTNTTSISFTAPDGRTAIIGFSRGEVVYSGDLPVAESAKLLFDAAYGLCGCNKIQ